MKDGIHAPSYEAGFDDGFNEGQKEIFKKGIFINIDEGAYKEIKKLLKDLVKALANKEGINNEYYSKN